MDNSVLCRNCAEKLDAVIDGNIVFNGWLKLMNYFEHELTEGEITQQTYDVMTNALMLVKPWDKDE